MAMVWESKARDVVEIHLIRPTETFFGVNVRCDSPYLAELEGHLHGLSPCPDPDYRPWRTPR